MTPERELKLLREKYDRSQAENKKLRGEIAFGLERSATLDQEVRDFEAELERVKTELKKEQQKNHLLVNPLGSVKPSDDNVKVTITAIDPGSASSQPIYFEELRKSVGTYASGGYTTYADQKRIREKYDRLTSRHSR